MPRDILILTVLLLATIVSGSYAGPNVLNGDNQKQEFIDRIAKKANNGIILSKMYNKYASNPKFLVETKSLHNDVEYIVAKVILEDTNVTIAPDDRAAIEKLVEYYESGGASNLTGPTFTVNGLVAIEPPSLPADIDAP